MVDTQNLESIIANSGKTKTYLARKLGRSIQNLNLKIKNESIFRSDEVEILCSELGITRLSDKEKIFFKK
jgi:hypothetical protein